MADRRGLAFAAMARIGLLWQGAKPFGQPTITILGYHDVVDGSQFRRHLEFLSEHYTVLSQAEVLNLVKGELSVPHPAWITFDDGYPSTFETGLRVLSEVGLPATAFICPGVMLEGASHWWEVVSAAAALGLSIEGIAVDGEEVAHLKHADDTTRRRRVCEIRTYLERSGWKDGAGSLTEEHIAQWVSAGNSIGNHTWDHPLLDKSSKAEQTRQITLAHEWIQDTVRPSTLAFSYPNGYVTEHAEEVITALGYTLAVLFDHRRSHTTHPLRLSRLRVNSTDTDDEFVAKVSGVHPFIHHRLHRERRD